MRNRAFAVLAFVFVIVATAHAGTITSYSPTSINVGSAEYFMTLNGSGLGDRVVFDGPGGTFEILINSSTNSSVTSWIPIPVVLKTGTYTVVSRGNSGDSNPVTLTIVNPNKPKLQLVLSDAIVAIAKARLTGVKYEVGAIGGEDPEPRVDCDPVSGSLFAVGRTVVKCVATNSFGERDTGEITLTVYDEKPPALDLPRETIIAEATQFEGAYVKYDARAVDEIDGELGVLCNPASESFFKVGLTKVSCTAADFSSNVTPGSFFVEVKGKGLRVNVPDTITAEPDGPTGAAVKYVVSAAGTSDPNPRVTCDPKSGSRFPLGQTTVYCTATDAFGERAEGKFDVNVKDTVGPLIVDLYSRPGFLIPLNKELMRVSLVAEARDLVDEKVQCVITGVTANQPMDAEDWRQISDLELYLRATISDDKSDREYTIAVDCADSNKNITSSFAHVLVPRDGKEPAPGLVTIAPPSKRRAVGGRR